MSNPFSKSTAVVSPPSESAGGLAPAGSLRPYLYMSFFFPPLGGPESRHNVSMVRALAECGFRATVLTAPDDVAYPRDEYLCSFIPASVTVRRFSWPYRSNTSFSKIRRAARIPENPLVFRGRQCLYHAARVELATHDSEFIYSVHGIGAAHLAARRLKQQTGLPWVAEFSDPLAHNCIIWNYMKDRSWPWWYRRELRQTRSRQKEILSAADLIVVESPGHADLLTADFGLAGERVVPYGLGYGDEFFVERAEPLIRFEKRPVIGFVGSVYYGYDDVLRALVDVLAKLEQDGHQFTFLSVGSSSAKFSSLAGEAGLRSLVPLERVSLAHALALMQATDFGLVCVGEDYAANINSKLWEYLKAGVSILALVPDPGTMADLVRKGRCGYVLPYDREGMEQVLRQALHDHRDHRLPHAAPEFVAQFSRRHLVRKLADRINELLRSAPRRIR